MDKLATGAQARHRPALRESLAPSVSFDVLSMPRVRRIETIPRHDLSRAGANRMKLLPWRIGTNFIMAAGECTSVGGGDVTMPPRHGHVGRPHLPPRDVSI